MEIHERKSRLGYVVGEREGDTLHGNVFSIDAFVVKDSPDNAFEQIEFMCGVAPKREEYGGHEIPKPRVPIRRRKDVIYSVPLHDGDRLYFSLKILEHVNKSVSENSSYQTKPAEKQVHPKFSVTVPMIDVSLEEAASFISHNLTENLIEITKKNFGNEIKSYRWTEPVEGGLRVFRNERIFDELRTIARYRIRKMVENTFKTEVSYDPKVIAEFLQR